MKAACAAFAAGSSPLARGLPRCWPPRGGPRRIIPARAGFTGRAAGGGRRGRDHPRSRGVYGYEDALERASQGSSPLARGLRKPKKKTPQRGRIIPARAGFTWLTRWLTSPDRDHPRSRGVYAGKGRGGAVMAGSSPLARGLRRPGTAARRRPGIIPARAGFTSWPACLTRPGTDHPRSRGVYSIQHELRHTRLGSSPLARGLRVLGGPRLHARRIIPARAGFTGPGPDGPVGEGDHPRSRGVYSPTGSPAPAPRGSSPLARGLLYMTDKAVSSAGIIPARAGFTCQDCGR